MNYITEFNAVTGRLQEMACECCGAPALSSDMRETTCHFCEAYVSTSRLNLEQGNAELYKKLSAIQSKFGASPVSEVKSLVDSLVGKSADIRILYGAANIYRFLSDYSYLDLDYNRMGFMEENSANIYSSLDLISKAKELFYKVIKLSGDYMKTNLDKKILFLQFLSNMRLKRMFYARRSFDAIASLRAGDLIEEYSHMVYGVYSNSKDSDSLLDNLIKRGNINSFYYLARRLVNKKRYNEAVGILGELTKRVHMPMALLLVHNVKRFQDETRL